MNTTLIANTGIQFIEFSARIEKNDLKLLKFVYLEGLDINRMSHWLEELTLLKEEDCFVNTDTFTSIPKDHHFDSDLEYLQSIGAKTYIEGQENIFEIGNINKTLKTFEKIWIPLPQFKHNGINNDFFGPADWVRMQYEIIEDNLIKGVLAVDTAISTDRDNTVSPFLDDNPNENRFRLCANKKLILAFLDKLNNCEWVNDYLSKFFKFEEGESFTKHLATYIHFIQIISSTRQIPEIQLLSDKGGSIDVDLVIDVGNSKTCGLLFENPNDEKFNFNKVKRLELRDISSPLKVYSESFSTRLVFKDAQFGILNTELNQNNKFQWPSPVRIGDEAEKTINHTDVNVQLQRETKSYNSSPKRYLWDSEPSKLEWEFHLEKENTPKSVFKKGISEQLKGDGSYCADDLFGTKAMYSRKSLMTFVYLEIFSQAISQINSINFRSSHGNPSDLRRIKRVLISCPTGMIQEEQLALRKCAEDALKIITQYFGIVDTDEKNDSNISDQIEIIPSVRDLKFTGDQVENKKDWIYDEATSSQLVYLYGLFQHKYNGNPNLPFELQGKYKVNSLNDEKSIRIGSLDIGGGTSDLMICQHDFDFENATTVTPNPLYWESFNLAGDDLLKNIIQQIIIEGSINSEEEKGCSGVIENFGGAKGINDMRSKLNGYFGKDNANIDYETKLMRINFVNQIGIPIALKYMNIANNDASGIDSKYFCFEDFFPDKKPNQALLDHFEAYFGFKFENITWNLSSNKVNSIIESTFAKLIEQISQLMQKYSCDVILLSGRPCSFKSLENLFIKNFPNSPNRIINLNYYWIGRWYPFANNNGIIEDPKTVVAVGSLIALMGGKLFKLDKFKIDTKNLKKNLVSTANFMGEIKDSFIGKSIITPQQSESVFFAHDIPFSLGFKQVNANNYPSRNIYKFCFDNERLKKRMGGLPNANTNTINDAVEAYKTKLMSKLPFKVTFSREFKDNKELIKMEEILDNEEEEVSKTYFKLKVQTLPNETGYWLDSGEFTLNISNQLS